MASIFHNKNLIGVAKKRVTPLRRQVQNMGDYFFDLLIHHRVLLLSICMGASLFVAFTHRPTRVMARSLITFQVGNVTQAGLVAGGEMAELMGRSDNIRERQLHFLKSYEFYRILAADILNKEEYQDIKTKLLGQSMRPATSWFAFSKAAREPLMQIAEQLRGMVVVAGNGDNNIQIEVESASQSFSLRLSQVINKTAVKLIQETQFQNISAGQENLNSQINDVKFEINAINKEIVKYKKDHKILSTQTMPDDLRNSISNLSKALIESEIQLQENTYLLTELNGRAEDSRERILATQGVGYHDQVLDTKIQELKDQRAMLTAKIQGLQNIIAKENSRFRFVAEGEEKINQLKNNMTVKFEQLNQLEQRFKQMESLGNQLKYSIRELGESFILETRNGMSLSTKLVVLNSVLFLLASMLLFYWYEVFPVLSYRDPQIAELEAISTPWFKAGLVKRIQRPVLHKAQRLCAQNILQKLPGPGLHQIVSTKSGEGKSYLTALLARELTTQGQKVCIIDLSGTGQYEAIDGVKLINDAQSIDSFLQDPKCAAFLSGGAPWVLVDSGSLNQQIGHLLVSPYMDGMIFVGSYLQTKTDRFTDWHLKIEHMAGKKALFVLNKTDLRVDLPFLLMAPAMNEEKSNRKVS
jgi:hypothetical protein